jgi:hypothetical protein
MPSNVARRKKVIPWLFSPIPLTLINAPRLPPKALHVAAAIAGEINFAPWNTTYYAELTAVDLAEKAGVGSARTAQRIAKRLKDDGYISIENRRRGGARYRFNPEVY